MRLLAVMVALVAFAGQAAAQAVGAPPGAGWQWCAAPGCVSPVGDAVEGAAWEAAVVERQLYLDCSAAWVRGSVFVGLTVAVFTPDYCTDAGGVDVPDPGGGVWVRLVYLSADPPASAASSSTATEATAQSIDTTLQLLAYLGFPLMGGIGYAGGRLR